LEEEFQFGLLPRCRNTQRDDSDKENFGHRAT
jgi:hypothetical protein